ncbi:helix-turn-helix domain-containing protein [Modestobacter sp. I12A-02628]|uniref:Winged helix-turn-helix transcriptional regulator n=1 Tax=Goekera deserti TaxID=2497753 RepID=A0A7K3WIE5_9ACTN|nr:helix-turn-helix domain-containing protein [Goekera deserti]NDI50540.1 helix-turn-helix domain-containing protein [Goekera deserti]NEL56146.1 winged helix-turn-helix transcriptional regulator [Goekera deserti]
MPTPGRRRRPATDAEARALASTVRLRILRLCLDEPLTNKEIAGRLGRDPATVLHHVRTLTEHGFLAAQPARRGTRGAREVPYLATGLSWDLEWGDRPALDHDLLLRTFLEEVAVVGEQRLESTRLGLRLSSERLAEFRERLHGLLDEYARAPSDPGGERWSVYVGMHPEG